MTLLGDCLKGLVPVLAANKAIPDSPWFLTAKIDISEVMAPLRKWVFFIPFLTLTLLATAGLSVAFVWRSRDAQFYRQQYESEAERRALAHDGRMVEIALYCPRCADFKTEAETGPAFDGDLEEVVVTVPERVGARSERLAVSLFAPVRPVIPVGCSEAHLAGEPGAWHGGRYGRPQGPSSADRAWPNPCDAP